MKFAKKNGYVRKLKKNVLKREKKLNKLLMNKYYIAYNIYFVALLMNNKQKRGKKML